MCSADELMIGVSGVGMNVVIGLVTRLFAIAMSLIFPLLFGPIIRLFLKPLRIFCPFVRYFPFLDFFLAWPNLLLLGVLR